MAIPTHLLEADYPKNFPPDLDSFPTVENEHHYIDAWLINSAFNSLLAIQALLIPYALAVSPPYVGLIPGVDGQLIVPIPPATYGSHRATLASDANLVPENIKAGVTIFGVEGTL